MIDVITALRIALRAIPVALAAIGLLGGMSGLDLLTSGQVRRARITGIDRIEEEKVSTDKGPVQTWEIAYVTCTFLSEGDPDARGDRQGQDGEVIHWGTFDGEAEELIGTEFWAEVASSGVRPLRDRFAGILALPTIAALLLMANAAPVFTFGRTDSERSLRWRGNKRDVAVGLLIVIATVSSFVVVAANDSPSLVTLGSLTAVVIATSFVALIYAGAATFRLSFIAR